MTCILEIRRFEESCKSHEALDLPRRMGWPSTGNSMLGTLARGARSEKVETVRAALWLRDKRVHGIGEDDWIAVEEVGTGVG